MAFLSLSEQEREVVSLQVGGVAQWVGTHAWNLDRAGAEPSRSHHDSWQGEAVPRLAAFDLCGRRGATHSGGTHAC